MGRFAVVRPRWQDAGLDRCGVGDPPLGCGHRPRGIPAARPPVGNPCPGGFAGRWDGLHRRLRRHDPPVGPGLRRELGIIARFPDPADSWALAPDGKTLLVGGGHGRRFALWSVSQRREIRRFPRVNDSRPLRALAWSPDGKTVAAEERVWDAETGQVVVTFQNPDGEWAVSCGFYCPDGRQVIARERGGARIWDIATGKPMRWAIRSDTVRWLNALSPDGRFAASGGIVARYQNGKIDPPIRIWELASGQEVATLEGHEESTQSLVFFPGGRFLVSGSGDRRTAHDATVRVWDLATAHELRRFEGHRGAVNAVALTPDGRSVVSGSEDATALVWDVSDLVPQQKPEPLTAECAPGPMGRTGQPRRPRRLPRRLGAQRPVGRDVSPRPHSARCGCRADHIPRSPAHRAHPHGTGARPHARGPRGHRAPGPRRARRPRDPRSPIDARPPGSTGLPLASLGPTIDFIYIKYIYYLY